MKKILFLTGFLAQVALAQIDYKPKVEKIKGQLVVCPASLEDANTYVGPPSFIEDALNKKLRLEPKSTFNVKYIGFPPAAQRAFQAAVDIWAGLISSSVPINVTAHWEDLDSGILGAASPADYIRNTNGVQKAFTWYPIALAEKIANKDLNPGEPDVEARFSKNINWYLSSAGAPGTGQYDFTTVVLHELCHGLGFTGSLRVSGNSGSWGYGTGSPFIFDHFVENGSGGRLIDTVSFKNSSASLKSQITSDNLFFGGAAATKGNTDTKPKLHAPTTYSGGSSVYHMDGATYPAGNANSLMTETAAQREVMKDPGAVVMGVFDDMGWRTTSVMHDRLSDTEDKSAPINFVTKIVSDFTVNESTIKLVYSINDSLFKNPVTQVLNKGAKANEYSFTLPNSAADKTIRYYFEAKDNTGKTFTNPPEAPRYLWSFKVKDDKEIPEMIHYPLESLFEGDTAFVTVAASDNIGVDTVFVEYAINGVSKPAFGLKKIATELFDGFFPVAEMKSGAKISYRVTVVDQAKAKNKVFSPSNTAFNSFEVIKLNAIANKYINNFDAASTDFTGDFNIATPANFLNGALHSPHPYKNGTGPGNESSYIALLKTPIKINKDSASISFNEVVLVEPGEKGAKFGSPEFYDYVVVEGSTDGYNWIPFEDGYDAATNSIWLNTFNNSLQKDSDGIDNSTALGTRQMFAERTINMLSSGEFADGDVVLVRFRLLADELSYGWGWAIDNLRIQSPPPPPILATKPEVSVDLSVSPNPTTDEVQIKKVLRGPGKVIVEMINTTGGKAFSKEYQTETNVFHERINLKAIPEGSYIMRVYTADNVTWKRLIVRH